MLLFIFIFNFVFKLNISAMFFVKKNWNVVKIFSNEMHKQKAIKMFIHQMAFSCENICPFAYLSWNLKAMFTEIQFWYR